MRSGKWGKLLEERIPVGALVQIKVLDRPEEYGIVLDTNYGFYENSWYLVYGLSSGKSYHAYPNELLWLNKKTVKLRATQY